jgi:hypothetical protein
MLGLFIGSDRLGFFLEEIFLGFHGLLDKTGSWFFLDHLRLRDAFELDFPFRVFWFLTGFSILRQRCTFYVRSSTLFD